LVNRREREKRKLCPMCDLFAMSSRSATEARASLEAFARHVAQTAEPVS
jgi:hypothetical protein